AAASSGSRTGPGCCCASTSACMKEGRRSRSARTFVRKPLIYLAHCFSVCVCRWRSSFANYETTKIRRDEDPRRFQGEESTCKNSGWVCGLESFEEIFHEGVSWGGLFGRRCGGG